MPRVHIFSGGHLAASEAQPAGAIHAPGLAHVPGLRHNLEIPAAGSRRRRLWELDHAAYCPVVGVCLPMGELRKLAIKLLPDQRHGSDYELHCAVVSASKSRNPLSEALQKELERRFRLSIQRTSKLRVREALVTWWRDNAAGEDLAGTLWSLLTHGSCDAALAQQVLGEVHMLQHQVGIMSRVDVARLQAAAKAAMARELADVQARLQRTCAEAARRAQSLEGEIMRLRATLIGRDSLLAQQREQLDALQSGAAVQRERDLLREVERLGRRVQELQDELDRAGEEVQPTSHISERMEQPDDTPAAAQTRSASTACDLARRAVLCVGGRPSSVPIYRDAVERAGARFLHHDGDDADRAARLEATLRAADLVICQTGCISHGAYWRVKDHCKRTGTPCLFVETPSRSALQRALTEAAARIVLASRGSTRERGQSSEIGLADVVAGQPVR